MMKNFRVFFSLNLLAIATLFTFNASAKEALILTGQIGSSAKQIVNAPQGSRWQVQIQWMEDEGSIVQQGESVVVFDGATEQAQLTQNQENLDRYELELEQQKIEQAQKVVDAEGRLKVAQMRVEKARIEASVPSTEVSALDKGQFELALQRATLEQVKSVEALVRAQQEQKAEITKKQVDILRTKEEIGYLNDILSKLNVIAEVTGPVTYAIHPWFGTKVTAGMNVRPSWKVLDVQSTSNFQIETWIHEIDAVGLSESSQVKVVLDAYPNSEYTGTIVNLSKQSEKKSQWSKSAYFPAIIRFDESPKVNLLPGMSVRLLVNKGGLPNA
ncbi:MAG: multidrug resistance efflux pump [Alphaproteobacteria bacterium]|jgi:multidrug resistance efflux pump